MNNKAVIPIAVVAVTVLLTIVLIAGGITTGRIPGLGDSFINSTENQVEQFTDQLKDDDPSRQSILPALQNYMDAALSRQCVHAANTQEGYIYTLEDNKIIATVYYGNTPVASTSVITTQREDEGKVPCVAKVYFDVETFDTGVQDVQVQRMILLEGTGQELTSDQVSPEIWFQPKGQDRICLVEYIQNEDTQNILKRRLQLTTRTYLEKEGFVNEC